MVLTHTHTDARNEARGNVCRNGCKNRCTHRYVTMGGNADSRPALAKNWQEIGDEDEEARK